MLAIYNLPNQIPGEEIIKIIRKDLFVLLRSIMLFLFLFILPLLFYYLIFVGQSDILNNAIFYPMLVLGTSIYYLFIWLFLFFHFIDYYLDIWIITSERIIDIEQRGFFSRVISEQKIVNVQDVTSETHGFLQTFLRFGTLYVQSAAAKERFVFEDIPDPDGVRDLIIKLVERHKHQHGESSKEKQTQKQ